MKITGVYLLTDLRTKKFYIGSSGDVKKRIKRHYEELRSDKHHNANFQAIWQNTTGIFETIFATETREEAYVLEQDIIDRHKADDKCLNIGLSSIGGDNLTRHPDRENIIERIKASAAAKISLMSPYERKMLWGKPGDRNGMWGKTHTPEVRAKISAIHKGNTYNLGRKFTPEHCKKISDIAKERTGHKNPFFGKRHSPATKQRLSELIKAQGRQPANSRKVMIDGSVFNSVADAARYVGVSPALIIYRLKNKNGKYPNYHYSTECPTTS